MPPTTPTTGILGLRQDGKHLDDVMKGLASFTQLLGAAKSIVVLTGAGISAESGIPTFRGAGGLWRTY